MSLPEPYLTFVRDPAWQFVGAILALAAIAVTYWIYVRQRQRHRVSYQRLTSIEVLTVKEHMAGRVTVLFDGNPVKSMHIITMKIWNSGSVPILAADFVEPLSLRVVSSARLLSADIISATPFNLRPVVKIEGSLATVQPLLLNPSDSFVVKLLVQDGGEHILPVGRIVGVRAFDPVMDPNTFSELQGQIGITLFLVGNLVFLLTKTPTPEVPKTIGVYVGYLISAIGALYWVYHTAMRIYRNRQATKFRRGDA
jgi:hypothetical protein